MAKLLEMFAVPKRLWQQRQEIDQLRRDVARLRAQNDSMREGMRRCVTCDYRIDFKQRQDANCEVADSPAALETDHEH